MNTGEMRKKSMDGLQSELKEFQREAFNLRFQKGIGQLSKSSQLKSVRRSIARIKTIMAERSVK